MFIYVIVCNETLKIYIGQHKGSNLRQYLQQKLSEARRGISTRSHLYASMRKHPRKSWSIHPLVSGVESRPELDALEQHYIQALNVQHPDVGYNICRGGEGFTGPHTEEWRKETLARLNAYWSKPENREQRSRKTKEHWTDPEFIQKMAQRNIGNTYRLGMTQSQETKDKISTANKTAMLGNTNGLGHQMTPENRRMLIELNTGRKVSAETRAKMKAARQAFLARPQQ